MQIQGLSSLSSAQLSSAFVGLDFTRNQYKSAFVQTNSFASLPGVTFSRSGAAYAEDLNGNLISFASGAPRITNKGLLIEESRTNIQPRSNELTNGSWAAFNASVVSGAPVGPDGSSPMYYVTATSAGGNRIQSSGGGLTVTAATTYTLSFYLAKESGRYAGLVAGNGAAAGAIFDLLLGVAGPTGGADVLSSTITPGPVIDGLRYWRCSMTFNTTGTTVQVGVGVSDGSTFASSIYPSAGSGSIYAGFAQLEAGSFPTSYIATVASSVTRNPDICFMQMPAAIAPYTAYQSIVWNRKSAFATVAIYFEGQNNPGAQGLSFSSQPGGYYPRILNRHGTIRGETGGARASECRDGSEVKMAAASDGSITYASINGQTQPFNNIPGQQDWTNTFNIGHRSNNGAGPQFYANTYIKNIYIFDKAVSQERLNAATQIGSTAGLSFDFANQTFRNAAGYVRANLLTQSNVFTHANWVTNNSPTIAINGTSPLGSNAYLFTRTTTATSWASATVAKPATASQYVGSIYAKAGTGRYLALRLQGTYPARVDIVFDLQTGTVSNGPTTNTFSNVAWTLTPLANGWYRASLSAITDAVGNLTFLYSFNSANVAVDGTDTISTSSGYVSSAQLEVGIYPTTYINTGNGADSTVTYSSTNLADIAPLTFSRNSISYAEDNGGNLVSFGAHVPRITNKGVLIEESRTNIVQFSNNPFSYWAPGVCTITPATALDSAFTPATVAGAGQNWHRFAWGWGSSVTSGTAYAVTFWYRPGTSNKVYIELRNSAGTAGSVIQGPATAPTVTDQSAGTLTNLVVTPYASGRVKVTALWTPNFTGVPYSSGIGPFSTVVGETIIVEGVQIEAGTFPSSLIPTTSASATRPAEICFVSGLNVASGAYFSLAAQADTAPATGDQRFVEFGTGNDRMILRRPSSTSGSLFVGAGGVNTEIDVGVVASGSRQTIAASYSPVGFYGISNGGSLRQNTSSAIPSALGTLGLGVNSGGAGPINGYLRFANLYYNDLLDYELAQLVDADNYFNLDFVANRYRNNTGVSSTSPSALGTFTVSRNSIGYVEDRDGNLTQVAANTARISNRGILVEESRTNLLLRSQALGTSPWVNNNAPTVTNNYATAPDGTLTATRIVSGGGGSGVYQGGINIPSITPYSFSGWLRDNGGTKKQVVLALSQNWFGGTDGDRSVWVDLATAKETGRHADLNAAIVNVTMKNNGWIYFEIVFTPTSTTANGAVVVYANTASTDFLAWGMQLEVGTLATSYIPTTTAAATRPNEDVSVVTPANNVNPFNNDYTLYMQAVHGTKSTTVTHRLGGPGMTGADNLNRLGFVVNTGGASLVALYNAGASVSNTIASPKFAKGHVVKLGIRRSGTGYSTSLSGIYDTGNNLTSAAPTFQCIWIGKDPGSNTVYWNGYVEKVALIPYAVSDHDFRALTRNADTSALRLDFANQQYTAPSTYARANMIRNSTFVGTTAGVYGSGGSIPNGSITTPMSGVTTTINGFGTEFGFPYIEIRVAGTPSITTYYNLNFENSINEAATGQTWTFSYYDRLVAGSLANTNNLVPQINENTSGGSYVTGGGGTATTPTSTLTRRWYTRTLSGGGTVGSANPIFTWNSTAGQAVDFTLRFYAPQLEKSRYPSTFIPTTNGGSITSVATISSNPADIGNFSFTRNSTAYAEDGAGNLVQFAANVPRITQKGLMIEESRTNLVQYSGDQTNAWWSKVSVNAAIGNSAPDGSTTATALVVNTAATTTKAVYRSTGVTYVSGSPYTASWYVKAGSGVRYVQIPFHTGAFSGNQYANFDLQQGIVTTQAAATYAAITPLSNGWYRISATCWATSSLTADGPYLFIVDTGSAVFIAGSAAVIGSTLYVWGAQHEVGATASSYIPTTSASVTRAADQSWYEIAVNTTNCSLVGEGRIGGNYGNGVQYSGRIASLTDNVPTNNISVCLAGGGQAQVAGAGYNVTNAQPIGVPQLGMLIAVAACYDGTNFKGAGMGAAATTLTGTWTGNTTSSWLSLGDLLSGGRNICGYVTKVGLYTYAFGDSELQYRGAGNLT